MNGDRKGTETSKEAENPIKIEEIWPEYGSKTKVWKNLFEIEKIDKKNRYLEIRKRLCFAYSWADGGYPEDSIILKWMMHLSKKQQCSPSVTLEK
jgi:hypothetical protein